MNYRRNICLRIGWMLLFAFIPAYAGHSAEEWKRRSIYQIITDRFSLEEGATERIPCDPVRFMYCGGTWNGIRNHLDYIQGMGFDAIWISPIFENVEGNDIDGSSYHGYWTTNLYELNHHFGTKEEFMELIQELHKRDIWILLDVAINSMAINGPLEQMSFEKVIPFNDASFFHPHCWVDYESNDIESVQNCWLGDENLLLADVDTENEVVLSVLEKWIKNVVQEYDIDGIRFDAIKHAPIEFWLRMSKAADIFTIGEYFTGSPAEACDYQNSGLDSFLNFPLYWPITWAFNNTGLQCEALAIAINQINEECNDINVLGTFIGNHDLPRISHNNTDQARIMNAITFVMMWDGIPIIYYGTEQNFNSYHDPFNREALWLSNFDMENVYYKLIGILNRFRKSVQRQEENYVNTRSTILSVKIHHIVVQKLNVITVLNNYGIHNEERLSIVFKPLGASPKDTFFDIINNQKYVVNTDGTLKVVITNGFPIVLYPTSKIETSLPQFTATLLPEITFVPSITVTTHYVLPTLLAPLGYDIREHPGGQQFWNTLTAKSEAKTIRSFTKLKLFILLIAVPFALPMIILI
ncbi:alpha-amylase homolog Aah2 [Schizosaccharomyces pombe]|uniref:4-alpha-glucanotransferase aah2 n=1 Tax=Schizosaccharomyces pombe (strain 972 / ATCC 24843) TaxID=284812 RepID=AGLT2_SCHPO|nr:alpha-amylase 2 [Schizosaccharomyces pombe]Q09840.1 RecName: Full=Alpha-amylase 2; AltName: Full=1,4-alpha-D-glucan glucanohydrolase; Flags: Precursor [Schizosaccharomyces pombe 972h-]CAA91249.1 alpha-amylase homolog Aah2 (predicted) [Schizosaccharomyces pombe]|eukprot:NP_594551.1 alpha-amylase 2 [Schizosaccharomyces pombe]